MQPSYFNDKITMLKKHETAVAAISFIIFWDFTMFYQISLSPKLKRCAIITYKHGIYVLPHELPNWTVAAGVAFPTQEKKKT